MEADLLVIHKLADACYLPSSEIILSNIFKSNDKFKISFSISGTVFELILLRRKDPAGSFKKIIATGCAQILSETDNIHLSYPHSRNEFQRGVQKNHEFGNQAIWNA
jgi:alpha-amylase